MKKWRRAMANRRGFSLVELMIAMVILAIGILATMAMQFTALAGYSSASQLTEATELARTVEEMIHYESRGWNSGTQLTNVSSPFEGQPDLLSAVESSGGNAWSVVEDDPVSYGMIEDGNQRFCVYVAGDQLPGTTADPDFRRVAIAVVYPRSRGRFDDDCNDSNITDNLASTGDPGEPGRISLEEEGYRVVHLTTSVRAQNPG